MNETSLSGNGSTMYAMYVRFAMRAILVYVMNLVWSYLNDAIYSNGDYCYYYMYCTYDYYNLYGVHAIYDLFSYSQH